MWGSLLHGSSGISQATSAVCALLNICSRTSPGIPLKISGRLSSHILSGGYAPFVQSPVEYLYAWSVMHKGSATYATRRHEPDQPPSAGRDTQHASEGIPFSLAQLKQASEPSTSSRLHQHTVHMHQRGQQRGADTSEADFSSPAIMQRILVGS